MSILEAFLAGKEARRVADAQEQINAMQSFIGQNGQAIMAGDQNALGQLAGFGAEGLGMAMNVQGNVEARADRAYNRDRAKVEDGRADEKWRLEVEEYKKGLTAEQAAQEAAVYENAAKMALTATSPEQWDKLATENGAPELVGQFENRQAVAARFMTTAEVLKATNPDPAKAPETKVVKMPDGSEVMVQWNAQTGKWDPAPIPQGGTTGTGAPVKPLTEGQSKDNVFATRAKGALAKLESPIDPKDPTKTFASTLTARAGKVGEALGDITLGYSREFLQSDEYQTALTAGQEFLQAILRKDTGAAITVPEEMLYGQVYLPQPGDSEPRLQYKAEARKRAVAAMEAGMSLQQLEMVTRALAIGDVAAADAILAQTETTATAADPATSGPQPGAVEDGFRFKGGDPADPANWEPAQ